MKINLSFRDGTQAEFNKGSTAAEVALEKPELSKGALAVKYMGAIHDLRTALDKDSRLEFLKFDTKEGKAIFWHSANHIMAQAIKRLFPKAILTIGPSVDEGFYYDIDCEPFKPEDLKRIEAEVQKIIAGDLKIERLELSKHEALEMFKDNPYKLELIGELEGVVTAYKQGEFVDLCAGPHILNTGMVKAFKVMKVAGAYWHADVNNKMLQRVYGIAFPSKDQLDAHLKLIEEAEKRDHRKLGKELDLFSIHEEGPGFVFLHPNGMIIRNELENFWRSEHQKHGYKEIKTPIILNRKLWEQSGHWDHYKENMYFTKIDNIDFAVKPMNCPGGILVYKTTVHSYKEFPLRLAELGLVHRHELSGVLSGLFRVRCFTQDDAHIFMTQDQIEDEVVKVMAMIDHFYKTFGLTYHVELSTRPENFMGELETWEIAEATLKKALDKQGMKYKINEGDGAFYGPKIDFHIKDALGRTWQCATCQLDFQMPERFDLTYEGPDGHKHRPVMIHRVLYGAIERFMGIMIEHFAGKFPVWISPVQCKVLSVSEKFEDYARKVHEELLTAGLRSELDIKAESVSYKVRDAQLQKVPYILVVGEKEVAEGTVNVRTRDNKVLGMMSIPDLAAKARKAIDEKSLEL